ncbi:MAG: sugar ABC transporter ATP-binding protein [Tissierellia bacterium]|nr:sugar ABC transporter ATP-binding protein [Tissierellia bacterium]
MKNTILHMKDITKSFSGVQALKNASLELKAGEVHALMGENGAGKSTLMKILTGIYKKDSGTINYLGKEVEFNGPAESEEAGISIVHQELNLLKDLTVAQNLFLGKENSKGIFIDDKKLIREAKKVFDILNIYIDPSKLMDELTVGQQQMVEIAKVVLTDSKIIVFDEPTAALTDSEINELFKVIDDLRNKGIGIVYISHRMDEIKRITDRVTVMRDGEYIGTIDTKNSTKDQIIKMMVGRVIFEDPKEKSNVSEDAEVILEAKNLNRDNIVKDVSFTLKKGEILGFSGLMGAGRTEVARLIFGADKLDSGEIFIDGKKVSINSPYDAVKHGIGYLSEDRKRFGLIVDKSVEENISVPSMDKFSKGIFINENKISKISEQQVKSLNIKTPSIKQLIKKLSGGNQQKVVIAKWLTRDCDIFIFDEPTRGIDVGAKSEIYDLMEEIIKAGKSIIMISSELTEILRMSDRIIVMCEGEITANLEIQNATQEVIMDKATRGIGR